MENTVNIYQQIRAISLTSMVFSVNALCMKKQYVCL